MAVRVSIETVGAGKQRSALEAAPAAAPDQARARFLAQSRALLQDALQSLSQRPGDADLIDFVLRAANTIQDAAGLFGLERDAVFGALPEGLADPGQLPACLAGPRARMQNDHGKDDHVPD